MRRATGPGSSSQTSAETPVVRVVDDDSSFLRAVARLLEAAGFRVAPFNSAEEFRSRPLEAPGCVVLDLRMPGSGGLDIQDELSRGDAPLPVIFLSGQADIQSSVRAMKQGALDFLTKPVSGEELIGTVRRAVDIDAAARRERRALNELKVRYERLTPREREVFALVATGLLNKQIADQLGMSERTVKAHRAHVMWKMSAESVADLVRAAERLGSPHLGSSRTTTAT